MLKYSFYQIRLHARTLTNVIMNANQGMPLSFLTLYLAFNQTFSFSIIHSSETGAATRHSSCWSTSSCRSAFEVWCWPSCWQPWCPRWPPSSTRPLPSSRRTSTPGSGNRPETLKFWLQVWKKSVSMNNRVFFFYFFFYLFDHFGFIVF